MNDTFATVEETREHAMAREKAFLIVHPKAKQHLAHILPILEERWQTYHQITAYAGHGIEITINAAQQGYRWIIALGGDGTLNEVINGAMQAQQPCTVGVLPGGTINQWAHEIGLPAGPLAAARTLTTSASRPVDIGFIGVQALTLAEQTYPQSTTEGTSHARHHFIIVAGLGVDAFAIQNTTESSRENYGQLAFLIDGFHLLPELRPFPAQITWSNGQSWQGQPWDILVSNTRRYATVTNLIPQAHVDDGLLDIRIFSLFSPEPGLLSPFQDHCFSVKLPASVALELEGSGVALTDYLSPENRERLLSAEDPSKVMVTYQFTAQPSALSMAIPQDFTGKLFKGTA